VQTGKKVQKGVKRSWGQVKESKGGKEKRQAQSLSSGQGEEKKTKGQKEEENGHLRFWDVVRGNSCYKL